MPKRVSKNEAASRKISAERVLIDRRSRFSAIQSLTPDALSRQIEDFDAGYLRSLALTIDAMERRDYTLRAAAPKRMKAPGRNEWQILTLDDSAAAKRHKQVLEGFYNNLRATSAVDETMRGGTRLLVRQMMHSIMPNYSAHEIVWNFHTSREVPVTAEFRHAPLWFFEHRTSRLRYLPSDGAIDGVDMEPGAWMVTAAEGVGIACAVAWMFKTLPLRDWLIYCERHGMPGFVGKTGARKGSDEWQAMVEAVGAIAANFAAVVSKDDSIDKLETAAAGNLPYPGLVERMDRAMAALLRGADLSTISAGEGEGQGASLQGDESDLLEQDDCAVISETLQEQVDPFVIRYALGDDVPLAYFELVPRKRPNVTQDILIDEFFVKHGGRIALSDAMQRYGRTPAADGDEVLATAAQPALAPPPAALINERKPDAPQVGRILEAGRLLYAGAVQADWKAVAARLNDLFAGAESMSPADLAAALSKLEADLPGLLPEDPQTARVLAASAALELGAAGEDRGPKSEGRDPKEGAEA